jgi:hypothetical protein
MKAYVAGRVHEQASAQEVGRLLAEFGLEISFDWTTAEVRRPYEQYRDEAAAAALKMIEGARSCQFFVLLWDESLYGAHWEAGAALGASLSGYAGSPQRIYIVGKKRRVSIFEMIPVVRTVESLDGLRDALEKDEVFLNYRLGEELKSVTAAPVSSPGEFGPFFCTE